MAAEFIGVDAINQNLEKFEFDAIGVYDKKLEKFKRIKTDSETESDLIDALNDWFERMIASNPMNFKTYSIQLYEMPEGAKKLRGTISFTFALTQPNTTFKSDKQQTMINGDFITKKELELALQNQRLEFEKQLLQSQLNELESDIDDDDDDDEQTIGDVMQNELIGKLPQLIDLAIASMMPKQLQPGAIAGIGESVENILAEFKTINPDIESDLAKLLNLAKNNPQLFNMLINQLRSM